MKNVQASAARRGTVEQRLRTKLSSSVVRSPLVVYRNTAVRPADVILGSYPKSGNTWMRHVLTHLIAGTSNDWRESIQATAPGIASARGASPSLVTGGRLIKSHEVPSRFYRQAIVMVRDGRDVALSEYHYRRDYLKSAALRDCTLDEFIDQFLAGRTNAYGAWHEHVSRWKSFSERDDHRCLIVRYEDMKTDPLAQLVKIDEFLGLGLPSEQLESAIEANDVGRMKARERSANNGTDNSGSFVRSGTAGGWRSEFSADNVDAFETVAGASLRLFGYSTGGSGG